MPSVTQLRVVQINAENLFLFFDQPMTKPVEQYSEKEWQRLSHAAQSNKPLFKTLSLAKSLIEIDADIILMNEVGGLESLENFNKLFLNGAYTSYLIEGNSNRGIDNGYLVKTTLPYRCSLKTHKDRPLHFIYPHEKDLNEYFKNSQPEKVVKTHYFSRDCAELRMFDNKDELKIIFLLVHLKSKLDLDGIDPLGNERRAAELKTVVEIYKEVETETNKAVPILVAGDFNGVARKINHEIAFDLLYEQTPLEDIFDILQLSEEERATQVQVHRNGRVDHLQIDTIFVSPHLKNSLIQSGCYVFRYKNELGLPSPFPRTIDERIQLASDHYPVVATFQIISLA